MSALQLEVIKRWRAMFAALRAGGDVPPANRLRTEGLMEALVLTDEVTSEALQNQMDDIYRDTFSHSLAKHFGADWREFYPFPQIPAVGRRAPVYPSTVN